MDDARAEATVVPPMAHFASQSVRLLGVDVGAAAWSSLAKGNLYFTIILRNQSPDSLQNLGLAVPVAVCQACRRLGIDARIKWPNDVGLVTISSPECSRC